MDMKKNKEAMLEKKIWAVAGVTARKERYGYKIWKTLKEHDYTAYGVNPNYDELEDEKIYHKLVDIPEKIEVLDMVVGPNIAMETLDDAKEAGIEYIWFQPGSFNDQVIKKAEEMNFKIVYNDCIYAVLKAK